MRKTISFILLLIVNQAFTQEFFDPVGAYSRSLSNISVTAINPWAAFNNQAALAFLENPSIGFFAENRYYLKEINDVAIIATFPFYRRSSVAIDIFALNFSKVFSRQKLGFAYGLKISKDFSAGIQLNYLRTTNYDLQSNSVLYAELSGLYLLNKYFILGFHIFNPTAVRYEKVTNEQIPTIIRFGITFKVDENIKIIAETEHANVFGFCFKTGLDYKINKTIGVRLGFKNNPALTSFGINLCLKSIVADIGFQIHPVLGNSPSISAYHYFGENNNQ